MTEPMLSALSTLAVIGGLVASGARGDDSLKAEWTFGGEAGWAGWMPNHAIHDPAAEDAGMVFRTTGNDPQILSPLFELPTAANTQWVEIDLETDGPGVGELYYANTTEGGYGGLRPQWMTGVHVPRAGRQTVEVWPFWGSLGRIIRLRFDPPDGARCRLFALRIRDAAQSLGPPAWDFAESAGPWRSMVAADVDHRSGCLVASARTPQAMILAPVEPFDAAARSLLRLDARCPGETELALYWVSDEHPGLHGEPVPLEQGRRSADDPLDLRIFPMWRGTITHLGLAFGTFGKERLTLERFAVEPNDPARTFLRTRFFGFRDAVNRPGASAVVRAILEHAGGPPLPAGRAVLEAPGDVVRPVPALAHEAVGAGSRLEVLWNVVPRKAGETRAAIRIGGQTLSGTLRVDPRIPPVTLDSYAVPPPRPVKTDYRIGIYYFPGWSRDQYSRWRSQDDFPERDPVLGWYEEGLPEVADWHIKWAVENGISFFVYDWYWRDGHEELGEGLNDGFLRARYRDKLQFALMWANHRPFADHTPEQLLMVTDYWIARYFDLPSYLRVDGKPYVSFFAVGELFACLGGEDNVRAALEAMRERARAAGLPGLHIGACAGPGAAESLARAGFDSVTAYNYRQTGASTLHSPYRQYLLGHADIWRTMHEARALPYIPLLTVGWDSRPWHGPQAERRFARRPEHFAEALADLKRFLDRTANDAQVVDGGRIAILEAWNEWGEGSYIEPHVEFGFRDLEAVRDTFVQRKYRHPNIAPADVGVSGYDLRVAAARYADGVPAFQPRIRLAGTLPAIKAGMDLICAASGVVVQPGRVVAGQRELDCGGGRVAVEPADVTTVRNLPLTLVEGDVHSWSGGNRLAISHKDRRNLLPGSYVPGSLRLMRDGTPVPTDDYTIDERWGAFALSPGGSLRPGEQVHATYEASLRRIDTLVLEPSGNIALLRGEPAPDCPLPPEIPQDTIALANLYRPFGARTLSPDHVFVRGVVDAPDTPPPGASRLRPVCERLRRGEPVTVVCWGDSVTAGGDASTPAKRYVDLFASLLRERFPQAKLTVVNAGIGGSHTRGRLPAFETEVLAHRPDVVTLEFVNDMGFEVAELRERYLDILKRVRDAGAELVLITPHFTMPDWMGHANGRGGETRRAVRFLRRFAERHAVPLADASRRWEELEPRGIPYETLLKNGINHPDDRGHAFFAWELLRLFPAQ